MMCVGVGFAVVCLESICDAAERGAVHDSLTTAGHEIAAIFLAQVARFAGNMLLLRVPAGPLMALSQNTQEALSAAHLSAPLRLAAAHTHH